MNLNNCAIVEYSDSDEELESCRSGAQIDRPDEADVKEQTDDEDKVGLKRKASKQQDESPTESGAMKFKKKALPLPNDIVAMFADAKSFEESTVDHEGRSRTFSHVEGDWPSFVCIPVKCKSDLKDLLKNITDQTRKIFPQLHAVNTTQLHITLSRTVALRHYWIDPIVSSLKESFSLSKGFRCHLDLPELYTNDEKTRSFLGLRIILGEDKLKCLAKKIDLVLSEFGLAEYYENPSFHISIAWHLGDVTKQVPASFIEDLQETMDSWTQTSGDCRVLDVGRICLKTGNRTIVLK